MTEIKTELQLKEDFSKEYEALCKKYSMKIISYPQWLHDEKGAWMTFMKYEIEKIIIPPDKAKVDKVIDEVKAK